MTELGSDSDDTVITQTLYIKGMMCPHCEATVKKALEEIDGVESAEASFEKGTAYIRLSRPVHKNALKKAIKSKGYRLQ